MRTRTFTLLLVLSLFATACAASAADTTDEAAPPPADGEAAEEVALEEGAVVGLEMPTSASFTDDGGVYFSEVQGAIKYAPGLGEPAVEVGSVPARALGDHGFTSVAYHDGTLYATYQVDPGTESMDGAECNADDFGAEDGPQTGCPVTARLSSFPVSDDGSLGDEEIILGGFDDYCAQWPSHGIDDIAVGADGMLYVSAGDGASAYFSDQGQHAGDPCGGNGALRSQSAEHFEGAVVRLDPANPDSAEVVATGLRNPFRLAWQDDTTMLIGDVGWDTWEEVNRLDVSADEVPNYGWPCNEGGVPTKVWTDLDVCADADHDSFEKPVLTYEQTEAHPASITAVTFHDGRIYFGDYLLQSLWSAAPDGSDVQVVSQGEFAPIDLVVHDGQLMHLDITGGALRPLDVDA